MKIIRNIFPKISPLSWWTIFTLAAILVLQAGSVSTGDLPRIRTPLVDFVVEKIVSTLRRGWILLLFSPDWTLRSYQDGPEAAGRTVEVASTLSHVWEQEGVGGVGALLLHPRVVVDAGTPRLI